MWDDRTNFWGNSCSDYETNMDACTNSWNDGSNFTASEMCCACGGGQVVTPRKTCVNTDENEVNADGYSCAYLNFLHDVEIV